MSNELKSIIHQAKSELRKEKWQKFLQNKKVRIAALSTFGLILIYSIFSLIQDHRAENFSKMLHQSLTKQQSGDIKEAKELLSQIHHAKLPPSGVYALASLRYAALLLNEGKNTQAIKVYTKINNCTHCNNYMKDLSGLLLVKISILENQDPKKKDILIARIKKIEEKATILKYHIMEQRAFLQMQDGNLEESHKIFSHIVAKSDKSSSVNLRAQDGLKMVAMQGYTSK